MKRRLEGRGKPDAGVPQVRGEETLPRSLWAARGCGERGPLPEERARNQTAGGRPPEKGPAAGEVGAGRSIAIAVLGGDRGAWKTVPRILGGSTEFHWCGCFASAAEALEAIPKLGVRIVLVGAVLADLCGIEVMREPRARQPGLGIIYATKSGFDEVMVRRAVAAGANGCCLMPLTGGQLLLLLQFVAARCVPEHLAVPLTEREEQILYCLGEGLAYKEIADRLAISLSLFKKLQQRIYKKLHAHSRVLAIKNWHQGG